MTKPLRWVGALGGAAMISLIVGAGLSYKTDELTTGGLPRTSSIYVRMSDGVRIAVDIVLPKHLQPQQKAPALIKGTPYWRGAELTFLGKAASAVGLLSDWGEPDVEQLSARGYVIVVADTRGTGASFGYRDIMFSDREIADFGEIIDWAVKQPWSNGSVGAYGFSYGGALAMSMAALGRPALRAIAPSFDFPDVYQWAHPGGAFNQYVVRSWSQRNAAVNGGAPPCGLLCKLLVAGPKPVDADAERAFLERAIAEHRHNFDVYACLRWANYRDDVVCESGRSLSEVSPLARRAGIEDSRVPMHVTADYFDANSALLALRRFQQFSNPQTLVIGAFGRGSFGQSHSGPEKAPDSSRQRHIDGLAEFFDIYLRNKGEPIHKSIRYHVLNGGPWRTTDVWPPAAAVVNRWYFGPDASLLRSPPLSKGADEYVVDFAVSAGRASRYRSVHDVSAAAYPVRVSADRELLTYTSAPLDAEIEIVGNPSVRLALSSTASDGLVIAYLEAVRPDDSILYLTEGLLRLVHRRTLGEPDPLTADPYHSYLDSDAELMPPGRRVTIDIEMFPIAVKLRRGDRIRVAIAGSDAENIERIPQVGDVTFTIGRGVDAPSSLELPIVENSRAHPSVAFEMQG